MSAELTQQECEWLDTVRPENEWDYDPERLRVETEAVVERILAARLAQAPVLWSQRANAGLSASVLAAQAEAWEEGFNAGSISAMQKLHTKPNFTPNPYRDQP